MKFCVVPFEAADDWTLHPDVQKYAYRTVFFTGLHWSILSYFQGGPGHLYLLKNKVATFAKVEKEEDMVQ